MVYVTFVPQNLFSICVSLTSRANDKQ